MYSTFFFCLSKLIVLIKKMKPRVRLLFAGIGYEDDDYETLLAAWPGLYPAEKNVTTAP
jgi:hypothetical protein